MRLLTLILILALAAQPLQAGCCAMDPGQGQSNDTMQHGGTAESDGHACCDTGQYKDPGTDHSTDANHRDRKQV